MTKKLDKKCHERKPTLHLWRLEAWKWFYVDTKCFIMSVTCGHFGKSVSGKLLEVKMKRQQDKFANNLEILCYIVEK